MPKGQNQYGCCIRKKVGFMVNQSRMLGRALKHFPSAAMKQMKSYVETCGIMDMLSALNRGYYKAARSYKFYLRVVKTIFFERAQRVKYCFLPGENKIHIFKPPCNFLFIIQTRVFLHKLQCESWN